MRIVYATTTAMVGHYRIERGQVWPADDPVVQMQPSMFSEDPRSVLCFSTPPPELLEETTVASPEKRSYVRRTS